MTRLIVNIIFFVVLAVFIALNAVAKTDVNLFGFKMTEVPTIAIILISMAVGVLYSFTFYLATYFNRLGKNRQRGKKEKFSLMEKELKEREKHLVDDSEAETADEQMKVPQPEPVPEPVPAKKESKKRFGKKNKD